MSGALRNSISEIVVRRLLPDDVPQLALLMTEMQGHYRVECPPLTELEGLIHNRPAGSEIFVAASGEELVAFAACASIFPGPGLRTGLFLKELYVSASSRGKGIGRRMMSAVAQHALDHGYARMDWTADRQDERLLSFYEGLRGAAVPEKLFFRLQGVALADLAAEAG